MKTPSKLYSVGTPENANGLYAFTFGANIPEGAFSFDFRWDSINSKWVLFVTLPSGEVRPAAVTPKVLSWLGFLDFGIYIQSEAPAIGLENLSEMNLEIVVW